MAALSSPVVLASGGGSGNPRWILLAFQRATASDTFDLATLTNPSPFVSVTSAVAVATSNRTATTTLCTIAGTVVTVLGAGISSDAILLFVVGE